MKPAVKLLALDIDGTLLNSTFTISPGDLSALRRAHESGVEVILCTGRRHAFALPIAQEIGFEMWLCSSNGAVTRSTAGDHFHRDLLPAPVAKALLQHMAEFRGGTVLTFDKEVRGALVLERTDELAHNVSRWLLKNEEYIQIVVPIEAALTEDPVQAMFCGGLERMRQAEEHIASSPVLTETTVLKTEYPARDLSLLDVLTRGCSKGHAVARWAERRGIEREQVMAIGDNFNDIEMLEFAGVPVVMGNACSELKKRGWHVTGTHDEDGVASALAEVMGWKPAEVGRR